MGAGNFYEWLQNISSMGFGLPEILLLSGNFLLLVFLVWIFLRGPRLWYWKTNKRDEKLENIKIHVEDSIDKISAVKEEIGLQGAKVERIAEVLDQIRQEGLSIKGQISIEGYTGFVAQATPRAVPVAVSAVEPGTAPVENIPPPAKEYCIGKSGKLYSREDVERLIRE